MLKIAFPDDESEHEHLALQPTEAARSMSLLGAEWPFRERRRGVQTRQSDRINCETYH